MCATPVEQAFARHVAAVENRDRGAFLANFSENAVVEDPVGPSPLDPCGRGHRGRAAIGAFWDAVIGPGSVRFAIERAYVCGAEIANVGTIHNRLPGSHREIAAHGVFVYRVDGEGRIESLKAYWEYDKTMRGDG
ncbi:MAG: nuclear transport factor 2 family protein [Pseudomonadales bacterium]|nr:nuclear transport factor 2 family protein [Pseudomonadales bacterium]